MDSRQIFLTVNKVLLSKEEKSEENNTTRPLFAGLLAGIVSSDRAEFQTQEEFSSRDPDKKREDDEPAGKEKVAELSSLKVLRRARRGQK